MLSQLVLCTEETAAAGGRAVADGMQLGMNEMSSFFSFSRVSYFGMRNVA